MSTDDGGISELIQALAIDRTPTIVCCAQPEREGADGGNSTLVPTLTGASPDSVIQVPIDTILSEDPGELQQFLDTRLPDGSTPVLIPPLGLRISGNASDSSEVALCNLASALPTATPIVALFLAKFVGGSRSKRSLDQVTRVRPISAVVELSGADLFEGVSIGVRCCLVKFDPVKRSRVAFLSCSPNVPAIELAEELRSLLGSRKKPSDNGFSTPSPVDHSVGFLPAQLDPRRQQRIGGLTDLGDVIPLADVFELIRGRPPGKSVDASKEPGDGLVPLLSGRMVQRGGFNRESCNEWVSSDDEREVNAGDIAVRTVTDPGNPLVVASMTEDDLPLRIGHNIVVLRPKQPIEPAERLYIERFLTSTRCSSQMSSSFVGMISHVSPRELLTVRMPKPDADFLQALAEVQSAVMTFKQLRTEASDLISSVLEGEDLAAARMSLIGESTLLRQRAEAATELDNLTIRVSRRYPLPVAYRWRAAEAARGGGKEMEAVLHAFEVLLSYLAIMALVSARAAEIKVPSVEDIAKRLGPGQSGFGLGDWRDILNKTSQMKAFGGLPDNHPFVEVFRFLRRKDVLDACDRLTARRRDKAHLRELGPAELRTVEAESWEDLSTVYEGAEFIVDYRLIRVLSTKWDSINQTNLVEYLHLAGDHAVVPRQQIKANSNEIEADSLYLVDRMGAFHLLRPLLTGLECPMCGHWSTFHPDNIDKNGSGVYKSMEHGHTTTQLADEWQHLTRFGLYREQT